MISPRSVIGQFLGSPNVSPSLDVLPPGGIQKKQAGSKRFCYEIVCQPRIVVVYVLHVFFTDFEYKFRPWYQIPTNKLATRPRQDSWACRSHGGNQVLVVLALCTHKGNSISAYKCTYKYIQKKTHTCMIMYVHNVGNPMITNSSHLGMVLIVWFWGWFTIGFADIISTIHCCRWEQHH